MIDFLFTWVSLPHGNDARSLIARRMGYYDQTPGQQAQRDQPFFPVSKTVVFEGDAGARKNLVGILEAEAMLGEVLPVFRVIPFVLHFRCFSNVTRFVVTSKCAFVP